MRILLAHNSTYYPSHGGGDKSNRLLMEALVERGHEVRVVTRVERFGPADHSRLLRELAERGVHADISDSSAVRMRLSGVDVRVLTTNPNLRGYFAQQISEFDPDIIVTSTDDPVQLLFDLAIRAPRVRVVHLVRATIAVPFGPDSSTPNAGRTALLRHADGVVGVSEYVARYLREYGGLDAVHLPISLLEHVAEYPYLGSFENRFVSMVNPCAVKGISIFLELADRMADVEFAAVPTWGTTNDDLAEIRRRKNITVLEPFDNIDDLLGLTKVLLVPSVWAEARSRLLMEAMSRGVPVLASDIGGIREAHLGVDYLIPIQPITHYRPAVDMNMVPVPDVPPQNIEPWERILRKVLTDRSHYEELSSQSREAAINYARNLNVLPFEALLKEIVKRPKKEPPPAAKAPPQLTDEKKKLLALRLKQRAVAAKLEDSRWFSGLERHRSGRTRLYCFPYAGGGTMLYRSWSEQLEQIATVCAIRLPGRESRLDEPPFARMDALLDALDAALSQHLDEPFALFGHSMGAVIAFELCRRLRADSKPLPRALYVSSARAPQFRLNYSPPRQPSEEEFLDEIRRLDGMPREILENEELMRVALPALRADARLYRNYVYQPGEPFTFPIFAYRGTEDRNVRREHIEGWREQTTGEFRLREFPGGHFYVQTSTEFVTRLAEDLMSFQRSAISPQLGQPRAES